MDTLEGKFTVFDVETTGLSPAGGDRIVEIAGVRVEGGRILLEKPFVSLINPERKISPGALAVNNISEEALRSAPMAEDVLPAFLEFARGSVLVAHNAEFDISFLEAEKEMCWGYIEIPECVCTLKLSRKMFPNEYRHNLDAVARRLGVVNAGTRHRALADAIITAKAFLKMAQIGGINSLDGLRRMKCARLSV